MANKNSNSKVDKRFQQVWERFKDHNKTEGFKLVSIFDIYLPFWQCKQNVVIEKEMELDRFSRIILELVYNKINSHAKICAFLGIDEDSFVTVQFHFLLKNDLIRETQIGFYEITHEGLSFLQNKTKLKNIETVEFEYYITEKMDYLKNDLTQDFFDPNFPIDTQVSEGRRSNFSGYAVMQTNQVQKSEISKEIPHKQKPTFRFVSEQRNNFTSFYNKQFKDKNFYDFADSDLEAHKRSICFYGLLYENENNRDKRILEIRQSQKSVKNFINSELEQVLTIKATKYLKENEDFA
jgi:predicted transcriptional regulator